MSNQENTRYVPRFLPCDLVDASKRRLFRRNPLTPQQLDALGVNTGAEAAGAKHAEMADSNNGLQWRYAGLPAHRHRSTLRLRSESASADVGCSPLLLGFHAGRGLRRELQHGRKLPFREARKQDSMTVGKFNRVVMRTRRLFVDLPENCRGIAGAPSRPAEEAALRDQKSVRKGDFGPRQKAYRHFQVF
jgi:hypothetical protein